MTLKLIIHSNKNKCICLFFAYYFIFYNFFYFVFSNRSFSSVLFCFFVFLPLFFFSPLTFGLGIFLRLWLCFSIPLFVFWVWVLYWGNSCLYGGIIWLCVARCVCVCVCPAKKILNLYSCVLLGLFRLVSRRCIREGFWEIVVHHVNVCQCVKSLTTALTRPVTSQTHQSSTSLRSWLQLRSAVWTGFSQ